MTRQQELNNFLSKLRDKGAFPLEDSLKTEMEKFLRHDNDEYTKELQAELTKVLEEDFTHVSFDDYVNDYEKKKPEDTSGNDSRRSKIYGKI
jgi:hypothetical protein